MSGRIRGFGALILALISLAGAAPAGAHAIVLESVPTAGAVVSGSNIAVAIRFSSRIDASRSHLTLIQADGKERSLGLLAQGAPDLLKASLAGLAPGRYRLRWLVLALDGHITRGDIPFTVANP
jgi:methionine-rich copper-binding protein CopC